MPTVEGLVIDEIIDRALRLCDELPPGHDCRRYRENIADLGSRLAQGTFRLAVLGQCNRGKSAFLNALLGLRILPVSIVPTTAVPTTITWGRRHYCSVRFADNRRAATAEDTIEAVRDHLQQYVAEEHNPQNRRGVAEVRVECDSPILHHGTVLIDTPGFGSSLSHTTAAALAVLPSCDGALFLLGADLSLTRAEVDFLREVHVAVPRIFYIVTKKDLLSGEEMHAVLEHLRSVLSRELQMPSDTPLVPVTTRFDRQKDAAAWEESGMAAVTSHIMDFIHHDKYFTLSRALTGKLTDALRGIISGLEREHAALTEPLKALEHSALRLRRGEESIRGRCEKALSRIGENKGHLMEEIERAVNHNKGTVYVRCKRGFKDSVSRSTCAGREKALIESACECLFTEIYSGEYAHLVDEIQKAIENVTDQSCRELETIAEAAETDAALTDRQTDRRPDEEDDEPHTTFSPAWHPQEPIGFSSDTAGLGTGVQKRRRLYLEQALVALRKAVDSNSSQLSRQLKEEAGAIVDTVYRRMEKRGAAIIARLKEHCNEAQKRLDEEKAAGPRIQSIESLIQRFSEVVQTIV